MPERFYQALNRIQRDEASKHDFDRDELVKNYLDRFTAIEEACKNEKISLGEKETIHQLMYLHVQNEWLMLQNDSIIKLLAQINSKD